MSKLYISEKTLNKLSKSQINQKFLNAFNHFDVEHSESKQPQIKTKQPHPIDKTPNLQQSSKKELSQDEKIQLAIQEMKKAFAENKNTYHYSAEKAKRLSEELKAKKRKASLNKLSKQSTPQKPKVIKLKKNRTTTKKSTEPNINYLREHHLLSGEYASKYDDPKRQYAIIKAKNASTIQSLRKKQKTKHDWTDRFALK